MEGRMINRFAGGFVIGVASLLLAAAGCDLPGDAVEEAGDSWRNSPVEGLDVISGPLSDVPVQPRTVPDPEDPGEDPAVPPATDPEDDPEDDPQAPPVDPAVSAPVFNDAVLSADGNFLLVQVELDGTDRCLAVANMQELSTSLLDDLCGLRWIAVAPDGPIAYLLDQAGTTVLVLDLVTGEVTKEHLFTDEYSTLDIAADGDVVAASNRPVSSFALSQYEWNTTFMPFRHLGLIHLPSGAVHEQTFPYAVRSLAFSPSDSSVLVGMGWWAEDGLPVSFVHWMNPVTGVVEDDVSFPNCVADIVVHPKGGLAIMSPTVCFVHPINFEPEEVIPDVLDVWNGGGWDAWEGDNWDSDPASIIDLATRQHVGNVPGYGPISFSPDGETAVGFTRQETMMKQWNYFQKEDFGIILIRMLDYYWQVVEYGDFEPDFFVAPGGALCLHDRADGEDRIIRMSLDDKDPVALAGAEAHLRGRAMAADGNVMHSVFEGELRRISLTDDSVKALTAPAALRQVFSRPQNDFLVATDAANSKVFLLDPHTGAALDSLAF